MDLSERISAFHQKMMKVRLYLESGRYEEGLNIAEKREIRRTKEMYSIKDGVLYYNAAKRDPVRVVTTEAEVLDVLKQCHASKTGGGHTGINTTHEKVASRFFWKGLSSDVKYYVSTCCICQKFEKVKTQAPMLHQIKVSNPLELVGIDLIGPLPMTKCGNQYILTMTDYFTKFVDLFALPCKDAMGVTRSIKTYVSRYGCPKRILSDQGKEFCNKLNQELCKQFDIKRSVTSAYHPQTNGLDERTNQTVKVRIGKFTTQHQEDWDVFLEDVVMSINTQKQASTKYTPFFLMFGREPRLPIEMEEASWDVEYIIDDPHQYIEQRLLQQESVFKKATENQDQAHLRQKAAFDARKSKGVKTFILHPGDLVYRRKNIGRRGTKTDPAWTGPYRIVRIGDNQTVYLASVIPGAPDVPLARCVPYDQLKPLKMSKHFNNENIIMPDSDHVHSNDDSNEIVSGSAGDSGQVLVADVPNSSYTGQDCTVSFEAPVPVIVDSLPSRGTHVVVPVNNMDAEAHQSPAENASSHLVAQSTEGPNPVKNMTLRGRQEIKPVFDRDVILTGVSGPVRRRGEPLPVQRSTRVPEDIVFMKTSLQRRQDLTDSHVDHCSALLIEQFPNIDGLQRCSVFEASNHACLGTPTGKFVQILLVGNHWVTVSNFDCLEGQIKVYDSIYTKTPSSYRKKFVEQISWLLFTTGSTVTILWPDVARQSGSHACGLFAIANAFATCAGISPETCDWDQEWMWNHLVDCISQGVMSLAPTRTASRPSAGIVHQEQVHIYCICRQPDLGKRFMVECMGCKEWFHRGCEPVPRHIDVSTIFYCTRCNMS